MGKLLVYLPCLIIRSNLCRIKNFDVAKFLFSEQSRSPLQYQFSSAREHILTSSFFTNVFVVSYKQRKGKKNTAYIKEKLSLVMDLLLIHCYLHEFCSKIIAIFWYCQSHLLTIGIQRERLQIRITWRLRCLLTLRNSENIFCHL